jgi:hypothetical protein
MDPAERRPVFKVTAALMRSGECPGSAAAGAAKTRCLIAVLRYRHRFAVNDRHEQVAPGSG